METGAVVRHFGNDDGSLLAMGAVGALALAASGRRGSAAKSVKPYHFAASWDWEPWAGTYFGESLEDAWGNEANPRSLNHELVNTPDFGHPDDYRHRIYAVIEGGARLSRENDRWVPLSDGRRRSIRQRGAAPLLGSDTPVWFVWQAERRIAAESATPEEAGSDDVSDLMRTAWRKTLRIDPREKRPVVQLQVEPTDTWEYTDRDDPDGLFWPDLIVAGGDLVHVGDL